MTNLPDPAVALFVFNRPELTRQVFSRIAQAKPARLLIVADGPRENRTDDIAKCRLTREIVAAVDWPCNVEQNYAQANLGCRRRLSSGLDWVFEQVEQAIILEDDCLPEPSFFPFCRDLLERYRDEPQVMHISGDSFFPKLSPEAYSFVRYPHVWGWATWRRAWRLYDPEIKAWDSAVIRTRVLNQFKRPGEKRFWNRILQDVRDGRIDTWDYQWAFALFNNHGLAIVPTTNLVSNIGFGNDATHTPNGSHHLARLPTSPIVLPLQHPLSLENDSELEEKTASIFFTERWDALFKHRVKRSWAACKNYLFQKDGRRRRAR